MMRRAWRLAGPLVLRAGFGVLAVLVAASLAFVLAWNAPGGPVVALAGDSVAPGQVEEIAARHGIDRPWHQAWLAWMGRLLRGDLGMSWREQQPVAALIRERLPLTLALSVSAAALAALVGIVCGTVVAARAARWPVALFAALHAVPGYVVAQGLVLVFALGLSVLPVQGIADARDPAAGGVALLLERTRHLVLPVMALALHQLCFVALLVRAGVAGQLALPYVTAAMARGRSRRGARWRHALPNALLPVANLTAMRVGALLGGALVIEVAFALPGLGRLAVTAALARDHPVVIGAVVVACAIAWMANLAADLAAGLADPRLRAR
ncbi:ABC transporter permease [Roseomonas sp. CECT 9278]|uniref:ABC transporter permease n=1 Tax=Roseomonas sp. CECT 9278 TaxID=2845823 RepID=UPI001E487F95|nr:ABC transporter permease [Roseomonas sp. CECT 9278]CAH0200167.1 Inner membrane ABC transporter permease protein YejB [Roseomonas sp. CECT 9278]